jgi:O-antigen/teichoic acid export membrane protein
VARIAANVVANLIGNGWTAVLQILAVPIYLHLLGLEAYGLIGFSLVLLAVTRVFDLGIAVNREVARRAARPEDAATIRDLLRTAEAVGWLLGVAVAAVVVACAPWIVGWINLGGLDRTQAVQAVAMMGVLAGLQFPGSLYLSALQGLERQVAVNVVRIAGATLGVGGAIACLALLSADIVTYFAWQACAMTATVIFSAVLIRRHAPGSEPGRLRLGLLRDCQAFALGLLGITAAGMVLTQMDKIVLSRVLTLEDFGFYTVATTIALGTAVVAVPVFNAYFPRLTALVAAGDGAALARTYHQGCQLMAVLVIPIALVFALFGPALIFVWTGKPEVGARSGPLAALLVGGTALNALMCVPYALQLASGRTRIALRITIFLIVLMVPLLLVLVPWAGATGGAAVWLILNAIYVVIGIPPTHALLGGRHGLAWLRDDVLMPGLGALPALLAVRFLCPLPEGRLGLLLLLAVAGIGAVAGAFAATPKLRREGFALLRSLGGSAAAQPPPAGVPTP